MSAVNAFMAGLAVYRPKTEISPAKPVERRPNARNPEEHWEWRLITKSDLVLEKVARMLNNLGDAAYMEEVRVPFAGRYHPSVALPFHMVQELADGSVGFVILNKINANHTWNISKKYTRDDVLQYFAAAETHRTTHLMPKTKK